MKSNKGKRPTPAEAISFPSLRVSVKADLAHCVYFLLCGSTCDPSCLPKTWALTRSRIRSTLHVRAPEDVQVGSFPNLTAASLGGAGGEGRTRSQGENCLFHPISSPWLWRWKVMHVSKKRRVIYSFSVHEEFSESFDPVECWRRLNIGRGEQGVSESCAFESAGEFRMLKSFCSASIHVKSWRVEISTPSRPAGTLLKTQTQPPSLMQPDSYRNNVNMGFGLFLSGSASLYVFRLFEG